MLTAEGGGAGPLSQGGAPLPSPNSAPVSPALRPPCGPAQTPDPRPQELEGSCSMEGARWREGTQGVNGPGKYRSSGQVEEVVWCGLPLSPAVLGPAAGSLGSPGSIALP